MTVIAWDGARLAADRAAFTGTIPVSPTRKIREVVEPSTGKRALFGGAGEQAWALAMLHWMLEGGTMPAKGDGTLILVDDQLEVWTRASDGIGWDRHGTGRWAIGCGRDFALGAMAAGADAARAVQIASTHDAFCGGGVDIIEWRPQRTKIQLINPRSFRDRLPRYF